MAGIADCITRLVAAGKIDRQTAKQALDMDKRMKREFTETLPPAQAEAAAALKAAKALRDGASEKLNHIANQVEFFRQGEQRLDEHPMGRLAGLMDMLARSMWRDAQAFRDLPAESLVKRGPNVEGKYKAVARQLFGNFSKAMQEYKPGFAGATEQQTVGLRNMIREIKGVDTGDAVAKSAATGWKAAINAGEQMAKAGGKIFNLLDDWGLPQFWRNTRTAKIGQDEFRRDLIEAHDSGAMSMWDRDTKQMIKPDRREFVLQRAYTDITRKGGPSQPFSKDQRTFQFADTPAGAEAYIKLMEKYGPGTNVMQMMVGHLDRMAHEIALIHTMGPGYEANFRALMTMAMDKPSIPKVAGAEAYNPSRILAKFLESRNVVEGTWKVLTGQAHQVQDDFASALLGGMRNMNAASALHQAIVSVAPTESLTHILAANHAGMDGIGHVAKVFTGAVSKDEAAHLNMNANNVMDFVNGVHDYEDHVSAMQVTKKFSEGVIKATFLDAFSRSGRRTWAMDMLNLFAQQAELPFDKLHPNFRATLDQYGFNAAEWDEIRAHGNIMDLDGAKYLNPDALRQDHYERVMNVIDETSQMAMHQPDARLRSIETGAAYGVGPGKGQQLVRGLMQFKTFALSRMSTQMMRIFTDGPIENRVMRGITFFAMSAAAGALSNQALQVINGKDTLPMNTFGFWGKAIAKGGALGYYADLLQSAMEGNRSGGDMISALMGPVAGTITDAARLAAAPIREEFDESMTNRPSTLGRQLTSVARRNIPNTLYTRLILDRLIWDKLQMLIDPGYRGSFRRAEQSQAKRGAGFWWAPGETVPSRAPQLIH